MSNPSAKVNSQTQGAMLAAPDSHKETGKPSTNANNLALEYPSLQATAPATTPASEDSNMARSGGQLWRNKNV